MPYTLPALPYAYDPLKNSDREHLAIQTPVAGLERFPEVVLCFAAARA